jgi:hypothetical protein
MTFFFVRDAEQKYRFFSTEPVRAIEAPTPRWRKLWERAKARLLLLPQRALRQEQALARVARIEDPAVAIAHSAWTEDKKIRFRFFLFLQKQRTRHVLLLAGEALLLPLSALTMPLPGPNVFFYVLALLMITHWQALRGLGRLGRKEHAFKPSPLLAEWEDAVKAKAADRFPELLERMEQEFGLTGLRKLLGPVD